MTFSSKIAAVSILALLAFAPSAMAAAPTTVELNSGGATTFKLTRPAKAGFRAGGFTFKTSKGAKSTKKGFAFPNTGGEVDPVDLKPADVESKGTLTIKQTRGKAVLKNPSLELGRKSTLSFTFRGRTVAFFNLSLRGAKIDRQGFQSADATGIGAKLSKAGAKALNKAFHVKSVFRGGVRLGTVSTDTQASDALIDGSAGNKTRLTFNSATAFALATQNISATAIAPATQPSPLVIELPIAGGTIDIASLTGSGPILGEIQHSGGILFRDADPPNNQLELLDQWFELDATPAVSVALGAGRTEAADLDVNAATKSVAGDQVTFNGSVAKVNTTSSGVLQVQFGVPVAPGTPIGTNEVTLTLK